MDFFFTMTEKWSVGTKNPIIEQINKMTKLSRKDDPSMEVIQEWNKWAINHSM